MQRIAGCFNDTFLPGQPRRKIKIGISPWANMQYPIRKEYRPGLELEILDTLSHLLNFEMEFKISNLAGCGVKLDNGTWTGLLGWLESGEINMTGNVCAVKEPRTNVSWLRYSYPVLQYPQSFLIKVQEPQFQYRLFGPFQSDVWVCLFLITVVFTLLNTVSSMIFKGTTAKKSLSQAVMSVFDVTVGFANRSHNVSIPWLMWGCIVSVMAAIYSSFVTQSLMHSTDVERPFYDHMDLAEQLYTGEYRLADYTNASRNIMCSDKTTCKKVIAAAGLHGYDHFGWSRKYTKEDPLVTHIVESSNIVFVNGEIWTRLLLENFKNRHQLWLIQDEAAKLQVSAYFYRSDFELGHQINRALTLTGSYTDNVVKRYTSMSYFGTIDKKVIRGEIPKVFTIGWAIIYRPFCYYLAASLALCVLCLFEICYFKMRS